MDQLPDIINTDLISKESDRLWQDTSHLLKDLNPRKVVVLSGPFKNEDEESALLTKMLAACKLTPGEYHLILLQEDDLLAWPLIREATQPSQVILLGVEPSQLGMAVQFMPHQVSRFDERSWIPSASLSTLIEQPAIKNHLWNYGLKPVFIDKVYG